MRKSVQRWHALYSVVTTVGSTCGPPAHTRFAIIGSVVHRRPQPRWQRFSTSLWQQKRGALAFAKLALHRLWSLRLLAFSFLSRFSFSVHLPQVLHRRCLWLRLCRVRWLCSLGLRLRRMVSCRRMTRARRSYVGAVKSGEPCNTKHSCLSLLWFTPSYV